MKKRILVVLIGILSVTIAVAQATLNNDAIVKLANSGLAESLIISMVNAQSGNYDVDVDHVLALRKAGVSDAVITAMVVKSQANSAIGVPTPSGATRAASGGEGDLNDPLIPHDSGIYLYTKDRNGAPEMIVLERAAYQGTKTGGIFTSALTYGIKKAKMKAVLPGPQASIRVTDRNAVFYFYFEDKAAGLGRSYFGIANLSNPNQFALLKLDEKKSSRETIIAEFGMLGGSTGTDADSMIAFKSERLRTGLYKVEVNNLQPGEYCFLASSGAAVGAAGAVDIFDFSVRLE